MTNTTLRIRTVFEPGVMSDFIETAIKKFLKEQEWEEYYHIYFSCKSLFLESFVSCENSVRDIEYDITTIDDELANHFDIKSMVTKRFPYVRYKTYLVTL